MKRNIVIETLTKKPIEEHRVEMVEHKGLGHPDTICDNVCEAASRALSKYYLENFKHILHHNLDKGLLVAGKSEPKFNGGKVIDPIHITIAGRATDQVGEEKIPVNEIVIKAAKEWISNNLRLNLDHVIIDAQIKPGSGDLQEVFKRAKEMPLANDTSFGVGFAPLSEIENIVLKISKIINSKIFQDKFPMTGDDIKVMGLRSNNKIKLTIAIAMIDKFIPNMDSYIKTKENIKNHLLEEAKKLTNKNITIDLNPLDNPTNEREEDIYLTVTGFSAEVGDDGQVGRGNRVNALITPNREMSLEATSGKNPVAHVGKTYNVLANIIANEITKLDTVREVYVKLLSEIGRPIDQPQVASVEVLTKNSLDEETKKEIYNIVDNWLKNIKKITDMVINEEVTLF